VRVVFFAKSKERTGNTTHIRRGLEALGHEVLVLNKHRWRRWVGRLLGTGLSNRLLLARARAFRPDVVLVYTFDCDPDMLETLRREGARTATFFDDCPHELNERILAMGRASDIYFINNRGQIPLYASKGVHASFATGGTDPIDHIVVPPVPEFESDVAFVGSADERGGRVALMKLLASRFDTKVYGWGWSRFGLEPIREEVFPEQYRQICASAKVVIGCDLRDDVELYFSNRTWLTLGCGGFLVTRYVPKLEELLRDGEHLAWYRTIEEAPAVVARWLKDEDGRRRVAEQGRAHAHAHHSYAKMLERMLAELTAPGARTPP
jgi:hypothetical protein